MPIKCFAWTVHAEDRLSERGLTRSAVEAAIREDHGLRAVNDGEADWRLDTGRFVVIYDHDQRAEVATVRIVSVWRKRRRHLTRYK
jgi:hypothetical protein